MAVARKEREYDPARTLRRMRNFAVSVLLVVLVWLVASKVYIDTRSTNALDELYYSTLDARSSCAFYHRRHVSPVVLASVFGALKSDPPRNEGLDGRYFTQKESELLPEYANANNYIYAFAYPENQTPGLRGVKRLVWYIEDDTDKGQCRLGYLGDLDPSGKCIVFYVDVNPENLGGHPSLAYYSNTYHCAWVYDIDSKNLALYCVDGPLDYRDVQTLYASRVFELDGADPLLMIERGRQAIRDVALRGYLEGAGLSEEEVESELSAVDPIIDDTVARAQAIYLDGEGAEWALLAPACSGLIPAFGPRTCGF